MSCILQRAQHFGRQFVGEMAVIFGFFFFFLDR
jgi:hypothetical protein